MLIVGDYVYCMYRYSRFRFRCASTLRVSCTASAAGSTSASSAPTRMWCSPRHPMRQALTGAPVSRTQFTLHHITPHVPCVGYRYQCRLLLRKPIAVNEGQYVVGSMRFEVNNKFSYDIHVSVTIDGTNVSSHNSINLADQVFSYLGNV